jgi:hypothetical protein
MIARKNFILLLFVLKNIVLVEIESTIKTNQIKNKNDFNLLLKNKQKNLFILFLKDKCKFSDDIITKIPPAFLRIKEETEIEFTFIFYYCVNDGFCKQKFGTKGYPEFRYYPAFRNMDKEFIIYKHPQVYDTEELFYFFKNRIEGISSIKKKLMMDHFLDDQRKTILEENKKLVLFCKEDFDEKEVGLLKFMGRQFLDLFTVMILNCEESTTINNQILKQFFQKREENKKSVCIIKLEINEMNCFSETFEKKSLQHFFLYYQKNILSPLNDVTMNMIMGHKKPSIILFLDNSSKDILKDYEEIALNYISESEANFVFWIKGENEDNDYIGKYIQNLLGVSNSEFPVIRAVKMLDGNEVLRFRSDSTTLNKQTIMNFYEDFVKGNLINYKKSHLEDLDTLQNYHSIIEPYEKKLFDEDFPIQKFTFVLVVGDTDCENSEFAKNQFEKVALNYLEKNENFVQEKLSFHFASLLREELDHHIPNEVPILLLFQPQANQKKEFGSFFWDQKIFDQMIDMIAKEKNIFENPQFFNLNAIKMEMGMDGEL